MTAWAQPTPEESPGESCGNAGAVESLEIQGQDFRPSHRSLEISHKTRDSHIPTAPTVAVYFRNQSSEIGTVGRGKVEIQKQDFHFPTAPTACGSKEGDCSTETGETSKNRQPFTQKS
jgi:hypothetical protein